MSHRNVERPLRQVGGLRAERSHRGRLVGLSLVDHGRSLLEPGREQARHEPGKSQQHVRQHPVAQDRQQRILVLVGGSAVDERRNDGDDRHEPEDRHPQPGHAGRDVAEPVGLGRFGVDRRDGVLADEGSPDQDPDQGDREEAEVAQGLQPQLQNGIVDHERDEGEQREDQQTAHVEAAPRLLAQPSDHLCRNGHRQRDADRQPEVDVADQNPVQDPRQESQQEAHSHHLSSVRCIQAHSSMAARAGLRTTIEPG